MRISHHQLRALVESVLLEGFKDDQRYLIEKYPDHAQDLSRLQPKWITWLVARFGENVRIRETHPFNDAIVTVLNFSRKEAAIPQKYRDSEQFRNAFDERFPGRSPNDPTTMTVDELETILGFLERKKQRIDVNEAGDIEGDRVGKFGPWNLWMPTTRERSCSIAGYDPVTLEPKTSWCTARTAGSNLFYNYTASSQEVTLFYIIRDKPKLREDWLSVGFVKGEPQWGKDGGLSVDRSNKGLTPKRLQSILGSDYDEVMRAIESKVISMEGKHPAREKIKDASRNAEAFRYLIKGVSAEEARELMMIVFSEPVVDVSVWIEAARNRKPEIRSYVAYHHKTPIEILTQLMRDPDPDVRRVCADNRNLPPDVLRSLADDPSAKVRRSVVDRIDNSEESRKVLARLSYDADEDVRMRVARSSKVSRETLAKLADDPAESVVRAVAWNSVTPSEVLAKIASGANDTVKKVISSNTSTPSETLAMLASDPDLETRLNVAGNSSTPTEILAKLATEDDQSFRWRAGANPNTPSETLIQLSSDRSQEVRRAVAENGSAPNDVLLKLTKDRAKWVRDSALRTLENLKKRQNESRLRQLIRQML